MKWCYELANAIVLQAVKDYRKAKQTLSRFPDNADAISVIAEVERFFKSDWFGEISDANGEWILKRLREESCV